MEYSEGWSTPEKPCLDISYEMTEHKSDDVIRVTDYSLKCVSIAPGVLPNKIHGRPGCELF